MSWSSGPGIVFACALLLGSLAFLSTLHGLEGRWTTSGNQAQEGSVENSTLVSKLAQEVNFEDHPLAGNASAATLVQDVAPVPSAAMDPLPEANYSDVLDHPRGPQVYWVQELGMYDSGTNLLYDTLALNFPMCSLKTDKTYLESASLRSVASESDNSSFCVRWMGMDKHSNPASLLNVVAGMNEPQFDLLAREITGWKHVVLFAMIRSPLAQLQSWRKAGYGLQKCSTRKNCGNKFRGCSTRTAWLIAPCEFYSRTPGSTGRGRAGGKFKSLPEVWNAYAAGYGNLQNTGAFKAVEILRYEDLVLNPDTVVRRVADVLGVKPPGNVSVADGPAKVHGRSRNRVQALELIRDRLYIRKYASMELSAACDRLNHTLLRRYGYDPAECFVQSDSVIPARVGQYVGGRPPWFFMVIYIGAFFGLCCLLAWCNGGGASRQSMQVRSFYDLCFALLSQQD